MGGYQLLIAGELLRGRFRKSFEKPEPVQPNEVDEYTIDLHCERPRVSEGAPDHGAGAEHLVPADRPQSAEVRAEHLRGEGRGLPEGHAAHLPLEKASDAYCAAGTIGVVDSMLPLILLFAAVSANAQNDWNTPFPPHRIADNLYYVGSKGLSTSLITTPEGHILINSSFERTVPIIRANVEKLGFKFTDIKILLASHAHNDHVEGHALVKELTAAKVYVMEGDDQVIANGGRGQYLYKETWKPCKVDRVLHDGDKVSLGGATLVAHLTPGHTRGCTTWTMNAKDAGKLYSVVIVGSPNVNPGFKLVGNSEYPEMAADYARTFRVLKALACDIFLGAHPAYYDGVAKYQRMKAGGPNPFVDPEGYKKAVMEWEKTYLDKLEKQRSLK